MLNDAHKKKNDCCESKEEQCWIPKYNASKRVRTLIVGPLAIMNQWESEIDDKAKGQFNILIYYGPSRNRYLKKMEQLKKYDIIITTYGTIAAEYAKGVTNKQKGFFDSNFRKRFIKAEGMTSFILIQ